MRVDSNGYIYIVERHRSPVTVSKKSKHPLRPIEVYHAHPPTTEDRALVGLWHLQHLYFTGKDDLIANEDYGSLGVELSIINDQENLLIENWYAGNKDNDTLIKKVHEIVHTLEDLYKANENDITMIQGIYKTLGYEKRGANFDKAMRDYEQIAKDINY